METPRAGTRLRAAFDAAHAKWCGPDCPPSCRAWSPNLDEMRAVIKAADDWKRHHARTPVRRTDHRARCVDPEEGTVTCVCGVGER